MRSLLQHSSFPPEGRGCGHCRVYRFLVRRTPCLSRFPVPFTTLEPHRLGQHQEKKCASGRTGYVLTHQALGTLWMHPGSAHTASNAKRTGNVNSDAAYHGTMRLDAARHSICLPDGAWQGIFVLDTRCQGIFLLDARCQGIFLLDVAVSGQMASGRRVSWHRGYTGCQGMEHRSKYSCRIHKHAAGSRHSDSVQFYSLYLMYIYICYYHTSRFQHKHPASHPSPLFLTRVALLSVGN